MFTKYIWQNNEKMWVVSNSKYGLPTTIWKNRYEAVAHAASENSTEAIYLRKTSIGGWELLEDWYAASKPDNKSKKTQEKTQSVTRTQSSNLSKNDPKIVPKKISSEKMEEKNKSNVVNNESINSQNREAKNSNSFDDKKSYFYSKKLIIFTIFVLIFVIVAVFLIGWLII